ncbi:hypothetical protein HHI36_000761 [Cryptolaemus montrouzieri]|uniref:Uncharacterized protein n=1 Tax=Cryptolaemus montrouzieri TaxID=559131 RepID=A0ABD2P633_9CUCU
MKAKSPHEIFKKKSKPFLVFPLIDNKENIEYSRTMPKNPGLKLFTKIRPSKSEENEQRPLTATLEKPAILDMSLIKKIDMSTIRKEFLNITNLCRIPIGTKVRKKKQVVVCRPLSICAAEVASRKVRKIETASDDSWEDEESMRSARIEKVAKLKMKPLSSKISLKSVAKKNAVMSDKNNNKDVDAKKKRSPLPCANIRKDSVDKKDAVKSDKVPEPCKTCGRPNQPERFHSHPETPLKPLKKIELAMKIPVKTVYKSL